MICKRRTGTMGLRNVRRQRFQWTAAFLLLLALPLFSQTSQSQTDVETRADSLLKQLSLEEKIDLIGGVDSFYIRDIQHIHLPRLKMSDGPLGCVITAPPRP